MSNRIYILLVFPVLSKLLLLSRINFWKVIILKHLEQVKTSKSIQIL